MISIGNKTRIACYVDAFRLQFNAVARRYFKTTQTVLPENVSLISTETETDGFYSKKREQVVARTAALISFRPFELFDCRIEKAGGFATGDGAMIERQ
jgi:hypothetical protein